MLPVQLLILATSGEIELFLFTHQLSLLYLLADFFPQYASMNTIYQRQLTLYQLRSAFNN